MLSDKLMSLQFKQVCT